MKKFEPDISKSRRLGAIRVPLAPKDYEEIKALAKQHDMTVAEFVRQCIRFALDNME